MLNKSRDGGSVSVSVRSFESTGNGMLTGSMGFGAGVKSVFLRVVFRVFAGIRSWSIFYVALITGEQGS